MLNFLWGYRLKSAQNHGDISDDLPFAVDRVKPIHVSCWGLSRVVSTPSWMKCYSGGESEAEYDESCP